LDFRLAKGLPQLEAENPASGPFEVPTVHSAWPKKKLAIAASVCIAGAVLATFASFLRSRTSPQTEAHPVQITTNAAEIPISGSAISPDGRYLAYSDPTGLYLRIVATGATHSVALPTGLELHPDSWFPDGTQFVATQFTPSAPRIKPSLWLVPLVGSPRKLTEDGLAAAVSPDSSRIVFLRGALEMNRLAGSEIWVMNADGSGLHQVAHADKREWLGSVTVSPDGRRIAYIRCLRPLASGEEKISIQAQLLEGGSPTTLFVNPKLGDALLWTADGRIVYSIADAGTWGTAFLMWASVPYSIWAMPVRTSTAEPSGPSREIAHTTGDISRMTIAERADKLAFVNEVQQMDVYISELDPRGRKAGPPWRLTLSDANDVPFTWTPDSQSVVFISDRNGNVNIFRQAIHGSMAELLVGGPVNSWTPRLSPDGSQLLFWETPGISTRLGTADRSHAPAPDDEGESRKARLMKVPLNGGAPQYLLTPPNISNLGCGTNGLCVFSTKPGAEIIFFSVDIATGRTQKILALREPCCAWSLSPDGLTLAIANSIPDGTIKLISLPANTAKEVTIPDWSRFASSPRNFLGGLDWAADGKGLFLSADIEPGGLSLLYVDLRGNARVLLQHGNVHWAIPSPDGRYIALNTFSTVRNVWFVENF
jgi:Tol biopolymer transport system component